MSDLISRQAAIDAIVNTVSRIGLHDNSEVARYGATFRQHEIIDIIESLPSAQPGIIRCRNCKFASGDSRICMKFGHSPIGELDFCAWAERRTDEAD